MTDSTGIIILLVVATVAGFIRGFAGFGGPAFMLALLTWLYAPIVVIGKILIIEMVAASYLMFKARKDINWTGTIALTLPTLLTMPIGHWILEQTEPLLMKRMISAVTLFSCVLMAIGLRYRTKPGLFGSIALGLVAGVIFGASYIALPVAAVILMGPFNKSETRGLLISWGFFITIWFAIISVWHGNTGLTDIVDAAPATAFYFLGAIVGTRFFRTSAEHIYRNMALGVLIVLSVFGIVL